MSRRLLAAAALMALVACRLPAETRETSLRAEACGAPPQSDRPAFDAGVGVQECPGVGEWRVFFVSSHENSWLVLQRGALSWSAETPIVYDAPIGLFAGIDAERPLRWRLDARGNPMAAIVAVKAQVPIDAEDAGQGRTVSRLFVVRLMPGGACLLGRETSDEAALALSDSARQCD